MTKDEILNALMLWAVTLTGYVMPDELPALQPVSHQQLIDTLCGGHYCSAVAYYDVSSETVFYDERLSIKHQRNAQGFIVHEFVHYLQHRDKEFIVSELSCEARVEREREAYRVQRSFLREHDYDTFQIDMAISALGKICDTAE